MTDFDPRRLYGVHSVWESAKVIGTVWAADTPERRETALSAAGRILGPGMLNEWHQGGMLEPGELAVLIPGVWSGAEFPTRQLGRPRWLELFEEAGFISDTGQGRPTEPLRVYRGSPFRFRRSLSWTTNPVVARWFADFRYRGGADPCEVWVATVTPSKILAFIHGERVDEAEVIVDARRIRIDAAGDECASDGSA